MSRSTEVVNTPYGPFHCFSSDAMTAHLKEYGAHQRNELAMIRSIVQPGDYLLDIGGHIGTFCIPLAKTVGPGGRVFSFEPFREHVVLLKKNIEINKADNIVEVIEAIVTNVPAKYAVKSADGNSGFTTFRISDDPGAPDVQCSTLDQWWRGQQRTGRLDKPIRLMKADVEGMELNVIKSGLEFLASEKPILYLEVCLEHIAGAGNSLEELNIVLAGLGYHFFLNLGVRNSSTDTFELGRFTHLSQGGHFYDVLAVHKDDDRYPTKFATVEQTAKILRRRHLKAVFNWRNLKKSVRRALGIRREKDNAEHH
jgi:FkbM family methyltransferase